MIRALLIDDERPALKGLKYLLARHSEIEIAGMFVNPLEALELLPEIKPQVVFLDINMPQLQGIDAAAKILDISPGTDIIFVTAYDQYALEAFELHALDYLLKPVSAERLAKSIQRLLRESNVTARQANSRKLAIRALGSFQVGWPGEEPVKWRTEKTRELFAFLLHHHGNEMPKEQILDRLWPDTEPEKAIHQLHNGIYYIRKTLEKYGIDRGVIGITGGYVMKLGDVEFDVQSFLKYANNCTASELETVEAFYGGEYLEGADWPWCSLERERLAKLHEDLVLRLSRSLLEGNAHDRAETLLLKAFSKNPYEEGITELLLTLYRKTGGKAKAARHMGEYSLILREELGIMPPESIRRLFESIK